MRAYMAQLRLHYCSTPKAVLQLPSRADDVQLVSLVRRSGSGRRLLVAERVAHPLDRAADETERIAGQDGEEQAHMSRVLVLVSQLERDEQQEGHDHDVRRQDHGAAAVREEDDDQQQHRGRNGQRRSVGIEHAHHLLDMSVMECSLLSRSYGSMNR